MKSIYSHLSDNILVNSIKPTIIEIGVHWAEDTARIMRFCNGMNKYIGFEPDPRNIEIIKKQKLKYPIELHESAIGNVSKEIDFYLSDGINSVSKTRMTGANSIKKPSETLLKRYTWINWLEPIKVKCVKLDDVIKWDTIIDFLWADMQGAEFDMIQGGKNTLLSTRYMYLEYSEDEIYEGQKKLDDYMNLLNSYGDFDIVSIYKTDVLIKNNFFKGF